MTDPEIRAISTIWQIALRRLRYVFWALLVVALTSVLIEFIGIEMAVLIVTVTLAQLGIFGRYGSQRILDWANHAKNSTLDFAGKLHASRGKAVSIVHASDK